MSFQRTASVATAESAHCKTDTFGLQCIKVYLAAMVTVKEKGAEGNCDCFFYSGQ